MVLIERRDAVDAELERLRGELTELEQEADVAKRNLGTFHGEIARLRAERTRMLARLAHARARLRLQESLSGLSTDADVAALESVREHVSRLVAEVELTRESGDPDLERRLGAIREAEATAAARAQLEELKRTRGQGDGAARWGIGKPRSAARTIGKTAGRPCIHGQRARPRLRDAPAPAPEPRTAHSDFKQLRLARRLRPLFPCTRAPIAL